MSCCKVATECHTLSRVASTFGLAGIAVMHLPPHNLDDFSHYAIMERKQQHMQPRFLEGVNMLERHRRPAYQVLACHSILLSRLCFGILYRVKTLETHNAHIQEISKHIATYFAGSRVKRLRFDHGSTIINRQFVI
jgi:hypothetical protein